MICYHYDAWVGTDMVDGRLLQVPGDRRCHSAFAIRLYIIR